MGQMIFLILWDRDCSKQSWGGKWRPCPAVEASAHKAKHAVPGLGEGQRTAGTGGGGLDSWARQRAAKRIHAYECENRLVPACATLPRTQDGMLARERGRLGKDPWQHLCGTKMVGTGMCRQQIGKGRQEGPNSICQCLDGHNPNAWIWHEE